MTLPLLAAAATRDANLEAEPIARSQLLPFVQLIGDANYNYQEINSSLGGVRPTTTSPMPPAESR